MWWETVLIAAVPSIITAVVTNYLNKRKNAAEAKSTEDANVKVMLETYKLSFEQYQKELKDVNFRFTEYIDNANKRALENRLKIEKLEADLKNKNLTIAELSKKVDKLVQEACLVRGCSKRTYFKDSKLKEDK